MIIKDLFLYFARFPRREGVKAMATMGASDFGEYAALMEAVDTMADHSLVPQIDNYVYGQTIDDLKQRVDRLLGSWLYADYGEISMRDDHGSMAVTQRIAVTVALKLPQNADMVERMIASDRALQMLAEVHAHLKADAEDGTLEWLRTDAVGRAELVPFVASELYSYGWTLMVDAEGHDMLGTHELSKSFRKPWK